ncbi:OsmC family peroxiredoxin [Candidatus Bathyarchaeota archaeon]|nr:OsmC family peroxiredoxin [Candidatus Bathyarchaeota archaeon]
MSEERGFSVSVRRQERFRFEVDFGLDGVGPLYMDEPEPVGGDSGPNASKVLAAAMGNCLTASFLFCLQKARAEVGDVETKVDGVMRRNGKGRWRIVEINVEISPEVGEEYDSQYERCLGLFEEFCIVSKSVEQGIPLKVKVNRR